ncbi:hypothetical protein MKEN_00643300 [Mycena kentingensis (nom. inval.)]|nr:hypothetical protein MKEN_00643300 [Mycena kentingensis (nom. inval.)]
MVLSHLQRLRIEASISTGMRLSKPAFTLLLAFVRVAVPRPVDASARAIDIPWARSATAHTVNGEVVWDKRQDDEGGDGWEWKWKWKRAEASSDGDIVRERAERSSDGDIVWGRAETSSEGDVIWGRASAEASSNGDIVWGRAGAESSSDGDVVWGRADTEGDVIWGRGSDDTSSDGDVVWGRADDESTWGRRGVAPCPTRRSRKRAGGQDRLDMSTCSP